MTGQTIVVIGASKLGCEFALEARRTGLNVTLIDEHPQTLKHMSFDAPYFYGAGLPAALSDEAAVFDNVMSSNELLLQCVDEDVDVKIGAVAWGAFQNSKNSRHIKDPKVGIVSKEGNELIQYDHLVLATGSRDFVPSFRGWELPGVLGSKAGVKLLGSYQSFNGGRALVLGTTADALEFTRAARSRSIEIVGLVEPTAIFQSTAEDAAWLEAEGIKVIFNYVIDAAIGTDAVQSSRLVSTTENSTNLAVSCDTICVGLGSLPNVELPSAMGCQMEFSEYFGTWLPRVSNNLATTVENVFWLSRFNGATNPVQRILGAIQNVDGQASPNSNTPLRSNESATSPSDYMMTWIRCLHRLGGSDVTLCQCEGVTRGEFLDLTPPKYLGERLRRAQTPLNPAAAGPKLNQDFMKRMTRVGMGHCQGKRCRDEAAILLADRFNVALEEIKPATYRFPVRPIDLGLIAAEGDSIDTRERWPHWLHYDDPDVAKGK
jgi:thioredoxin reductase